MVQFESPWWFLALAPLAAFLAWWFWRSYADLSRARGAVALALRAVGLTLIVLALTKPVLMLENTERTILFLIDVSDSVTSESLEDAWTEIAASTQDRKSGENSGVLLFGRSARLVVTPTEQALELTGELRRKLLHQSEEDRIRSRVQEIERSELNEQTRAELAELRGYVTEIEAWREEIGTDGTDVEAACRLARGLIPIESRRRVMIYSDGNANRGDLCASWESSKRPASRPTRACSSAGASPR